MEYVVISYFNGLLDGTTVPFLVRLKCFHFLLQFLADWLGFANNFLAKEHLNVKEKLSLVLQASIMNLAQIGLIPLLLLWITGFGLAYKIYGGMDLGRTFNIKMLGATVHLAVVIFINYYMLIVAKNGQVSGTTIIKVTPIRARRSIMFVPFLAANNTTA